MTQISWSAPALALCLALSAMPGNAIAQGGDLSKGVRDMNVQAGTAEFRDVTFGKPETGSVTIGKIAFVGFVRDGERVRADRVDVTNLTSRIGNRTIEVPSVTVTGFEGSVELFRTLTEGGNADRDWVALLLKAAAKQITIDRMLDHNPALSFESVVNTIVISDLKDGVVGSAKFAGMTGKMDKPGPGGQVSMRLGEISYQGANFAEGIRLIAGGGSGDPKRLLDRAIMTGMEFTTPEGTFKFERIEMAGVFGRAPSEVLSPEDRAALQSGQALEDPERRPRVIKFLAELFRLTRIERYSLEGFSIAIPQGTVSIKAITFGGLSGRGLDLFEIKSVDVPTPTGPVRIGRFAIEKLTYGAMLDAVFTAITAGQEPDFSPAKLIEITPRLAALRLAAIEVMTPEGPVSLGGFDIELDDKVGAIPERIAAMVKQLKVKINSAGGDEARQQLLALGYTEFLADAQLQVRWQRSDKTLVLENTNLLLDKIGRVDLSVKLGNVDLASAAANPAAFVPNDARIEAVEVRVKNLGVAERFYALTAKGAGISQDAVREGLAAEVRTRAAAILGAALAPGSADALAAFLKTPGTLIARAAPRGGKPLTFGEVSDLDPPQILERLLITLQTAN